MLGHASHEFVGDAAGVAAGERFGKRGRRVARGAQCLTPHRRGGRFRASDECRAELRALCAQRECGGDAAAVHDAACCDHGNVHGVHDLRDERHRADHARRHVR